MNKPKTAKKILAFVFCAAILMTISTAPALALTNFPAVINIPNATATIDGVVSPGEWDEATAIIIKSQDALADFEAGIPGSHYIFPNDGDPQNTAVIRFKINGGYLYMLEEKTADNPWQFTGAEEDGIAPWMTSGSIVFFVTKSENLNTSDLFITPTNPPQFAYRAQNDQEQRTPIKAAEAATVISADGKSIIVEAKIALSDLGLSEADFTGGDLLVTYCSIYAFDPDFAPWDGGYQTQYKGVGPWDESLPVALIAGAEWPPPVVVPETPAVEEDSPAAVEEAPPAAAPVRPASPPTGDAGMIFAIISAMAAVSGVLICKKKIRN